MTQFFIKTFQKGLKCWSCKKKPIKGYKMCIEHLTKARERFANWSEERRDQGKCIRCDCKGYNGYLRCKKHTLLNREQCAAWGTRHPEYTGEKWARQQKVLKAGICICKAHNKIPAGFKRCDDCRIRSIGYRTKGTQHANTI